MTLAQFLLRRAGTGTEDTRFEAVAQRVFRGVKAANPWRIRGSLSNQLPSNVYNGSATAGLRVIETIYVNAAALPLEGIRFETSLSVDRLLPADGLGTVSLDFGLRDSRVLLTRPAKKSGDPPLRNADFGPNA